MNRRMYALGRLKKGVMNRTEAKYAEHLERLKAAGQIVWFKFEGLKLMLAKNTSLTPDFFVMRSDGTIEVHEVKGFWTDDAKAKTKIAAEMFPFKFLVIKAKRSEWEIEEIGA